MRKILTALFFALALASCSTLGTIASGSIPNITPKAAYELKAGYLLARVPAVAYRSLPFCDAHAPPCQTTSVAIAIKRADTVAMGAIGRLVAFARANDTIDLPAAYSAAQAAIATAEQIISTYHLGK